MNSCYLCHLHSYVFSLFSDSSAFFVFVHLNWRANQFETKIAGVSFDRWRFKVFYGVSIVLKVSLVRQPAALKVGVAATVAPSSHILFVGN